MQLNERHLKQLLVIMAVVSVWNLGSWTYFLIREEIFTCHPSGSRAVPSESRWSTVNHVSRHMMSRCMKQSLGHFRLRRSRCVRRFPTLFVSCWGHMSGATSRDWIACFCFQAREAATQAFPMTCRYLWAMFIKVLVKQIVRFCFTGGFW